MRLGNFLEYFGIFRFCLVNLVVFLINTCDALRDLVPFAQFKKHEKHTRRSVNPYNLSVFIFE